MSKHDDSVRLRHMLDAARRAVKFVKGRTRADLDTDEQLALALTRLLEVIGEAAKHVSEETQRAHPEIPWKETAATRDRLIHGYFDVDLNIIWEITTADLPPLIAGLEKVLSVSR